MPTAPSFVQKIKRDIPIHFVVCRDGKNRLCHYFLMARPEKIKLLKAVKTGLVDMKDYGTILASGFGTQPSAATRRKLMELYNFDCETLE